MQFARFSGFEDLTDVASLAITRQAVIVHVAYTMVGRASQWREHAPRSFASAMAAVGARGQLLSIELEADEDGYSGGDRPFEVSIVHVEVLDERSLDRELVPWLSGGSAVPERFAVLEPLVRDAFHVREHEGKYTAHVERETGIRAFTPLCALQRVLQAAHGWSVVGFGSVVMIHDARVPAREQLAHAFGPPAPPTAFGDLARAWSSGVAETGWPVPIEPRPAGYVLSHAALGERQAQLVFPDDPELSRLVAAAVDHALGVGGALVFDIETLWPPSAERLSAYRSDAVAPDWAPLPVEGSEPQALVAQAFPVIGPGFRLDLDAPRWIDGIAADLRVSFAARPTLTAAILVPAERLSDAIDFETGEMLHEALSSGDLRTWRDNLAALRADAIETIDSIFAVGPPWIVPVR